jgi:hypothetical protein
MPYIVLGIAGLFGFGYATRQTTDALKWAVVLGGVIVIYNAQKGRS